MESALNEIFHAEKSDQPCYVSDTIAPAEGDFAKIFRDRQSNIVKISFPGEEHHYWYTEGLADEREARLEGCFHLKNGVYTTEIIEYDPWLSANGKLKGERISIHEYTGRGEDKLLMITRFFYAKKSGTKPFVGVLDEKLHRKPHIFPDDIQSSSRRIGIGGLQRKIEAA